MPMSGRKNRTKIHLSQKRTCGNYDRGAGDFSGCTEVSDNIPILYYAFIRGDEYLCPLGFRCSHGKPLEPCYKPRTLSQSVYAYKLTQKEIV